MNAVAAKLREARALIERGWCQIDAARNAVGEPVAPGRMSAVCFCTWGALARVWKSNTRGLQQSLNALTQAMGGFNPIAWNDTPGRSKESVLAAFDKAIEFAEAQDA